MYRPMTHLDPHRNWTLKELSSEKASMLVPSIVYLSILMLVGVIGNAIVLTVYYFRFNSSTHRCFILTLAFYDFFACAVGTPFTIGESFFAYTYVDVASCKIFRFILYYTCIASSLTLVLIAFERFRKICTPLKTQVSVPVAKKALVLVAGVISGLSACPSLIMYGNSTTSTGVANINGTKCFITDYYEDTIWPTVFNVYLLILAFASTICMSVCYGGVARQVSKMGNANVVKRNTIKSVGRSSSTACPSDDYDSETSKNQTTCDGLSTLDRKSRCNGLTSNLERKTVRRESSVSSSGSSVKVNNGSMLKKSSKWANKVLRRMSSKSGKKTLRITKMLIAVTIAFVISYLPHLTLMLWDMFAREEDKDDLPKDNIYQVVFYSFMLNNLVNPFIYASMDLKFRKEVKGLFKCSR